MENIGIYGGTFDPIHIGHLTIAESFVKELRLDFCYFVPAFLSPFKTDEDFLPHTSVEHRLKMLEIALEEIPSFKIDSFELKRNQISYTFQTINHFMEIFPDKNLFLLIGTDQALNFHKWKNWEFICDKTTIVIASRKTKKNVDFEFMNLKKDCRLISLNNPLIEISSNGIRNRLKHGYNCEDLMPKKVYEYILANKLYF